MSDDPHDDLGDINREIEIDPLTGRPRGIVTFPPPPIVRKSRLGWFLTRPWPIVAALITVNVATTVAIVLFILGKRWQLVIDRRNLP